MAGVGQNKYAQMAQDIMTERGIGPQDIRADAEGPADVQSEQADPQAEFDEMFAQASKMVEEDIQSGKNQGTDGEINAAMTSYMQELWQQGSGIPPVMFSQLMQNADMGYAGQMEMNAQQLQQPVVNENPTGKLPGEYMPEPNQWDRPKQRPQR